MMESKMDPKRMALIATAMAMAAADEAPPKEREIVRVGRKSATPAGDPNEPGLTRQQRRYRERQAAKAGRRKS
jgi:hypothetical protein